MISFEFDIIFSKNNDITLLSSFKLLFAFKIDTPHDEYIDIESSNTTI